TRQIADRNAKKTSVYRMSHITQGKWWLYAFQANSTFSKVKAELHFQMQVFHIVRVLGGGRKSLDPNKR
ncbi:MAG: hypothetical protein ACXWLJ_10090, partial [Rhizomicrobium sp.]